MKVLVLVLVLSVSAANGGNIIDGIKNSLETIGGAVKETGKDFVPFAATVGKNLLGTLKNDTVQMVKGTLSDLIGKAFADLFHIKRDMPAIVNQVKTLESKLTHLLDLGTSQFSDVIDEVFAEIQTIYTQLKNLEMHPEEALKKVEALVAKHTSLSSEFLQALERDATTIVHSVFSLKKRNVITDTLSSLGSTIAAAFKPAIDSVSQMVHGAGSALSVAANGLLSAAKDSLSQLGDKLKPHVAALSTQIGQLTQHGTNAINAMKDAMTDIFSQTMQNAKPALNNIA
ncbi:uncharacterized protein LOC124112637 [Haliotis rufescens]|uniref:uncharacterized protein LOC124112637 n=1 Tax=Haliotis rufescens TaxID=6454 RepID=UPI00201EA3FA|nr:uncharacterized protein LOC124112637 [Haliotis rufescens]